MITYSRAGRRAHGAGGRFAALVALPLIGGLTIGTAVATPPPNVTALTAEQARLLGTAVSIVPRGDLAAGLVEVRVSGWSAAARQAGASRLLAVAAGGSMAAIAAQIGPGQAPLILARADGSQLQVRMPGLISAGFAPDASWLAVIDGVGSLWRIDASSGAARRLADGPFLGNPAVDGVGGISLLRVASVEAPFVSRLVRFGADDSQPTVVMDEPLVYGSQPLADGSLAAIVHRPSGTLVLRATADGLPQPMADLGTDAVNVSVSPSGSAVVWERAGEIYLRQLPAGQSQRLAAGGKPRFSPDGETLLVDVADGTALLDLRARTIATFTSQVAFAGCAVGCGS